MPIKSNNLFKVKMLYFNYKNMIFRDKLKIKRLETGISVMEEITDKLEKILIDSGYEHIVEDFKYAKDNDKGASNDV